MKQSIFELTENTALTEKVFRMRLSGDVSAIEIPGQFVQIQIDGLFLRRPFSVCDRDDNSFTVLYEAAGAGTEKLRAMPAGSELDILTGLGNGFDLRRGGDSPMLIGGGTGVSPMYWLAKAFLSSGTVPTVLLGFNTAAEVYYADEFNALGIDAVVTTADGSRGIKGFVTSAMDRPHSSFYACGPEAMLRAVCRTSSMPGQLSFDKRMGCGFGACMGCTVITRSGPKRICREGPVLDREEIIWED
ncbi:MAG: dihydroorotate dehydrogenase electron transfer subunit [Oscillospiraceae bacterium]|nr:dihydroorotate dehydrogenase electron transfer subunit [Oscillospiraceae bacterium]